ncbi:RepB-like protein [Lactiplantibacillus plantarum]|uniref:RepB-like protein n=1 Tax=Lactiplantibacillus plantarum TaxID=1590 RepID=UPI0038518A61|nr:RepB-like protein [Lactiplantibacillus plantarum]
MPKTIRELADELGVSKQAVWQKIKRDSSINLRQFTSKKGNTVYINIDGQKAIKSMFLDKTSTKNRQHEDGVDVNEKERVDEQGEVKFLRDLVLELQFEKKELHKLLDQQQRLALQDKKMLEDYKAKIQNLEALAMTPHDSEKELSPKNKPEQETSTVERQHKTKKWWHFGR